MSEIKKEQRERNEREESPAATDDDAALLDSSEIIEFLMNELREPSNPEEADPSDTDEQEYDAAQIHEYVLPISALTERRTLEELADMATGRFRYEPPKEETDDSPEDYFHHTRKLKALRMN